MVADVKSNYSVHIAQTPFRRGEKCIKSFASDGTGELHVLLQFKLYGTFSWWGKYGEKGTTVGTKINK